MRHIFLFNTFNNIDNSKYDIEYAFANQFPEETVEEVLPAVFDRTTSTFKIQRLNVGWALRKSHSKAYNKDKPVEKLAENETIYDRKIHKKCAGALRCLSVQCERPTWIRDHQPPVDAKDKFGCSKKYQCQYCQAPLERIDCDVAVTFTFRVCDTRRDDRGSTVTIYQEITEEKKHTHSIYSSLHIDRDEKRELNKMVKERPNITAAAAIAGIDPTTGAIKKSVRDINTVMANHDRTKYEIRRSKIQQDLLSTKEDVVAAFEELDEKYTEFMDSGQILPSKFFISLSLQMSLSKPFQRGITSAQVFAVKKHNTLPFLKGCYMHWMQSVKRISNNQQIVAADEVDTFFRLVHRLRTTSNSTEFFQAGKELLRKFPNCKKWLQWWLQPGVSSMVFRCKSLMKDDLRLHKSRTSNAIEAFHSALYKLMPVKRQPVSTSLRLLLQVAKRDGIMLMDFYANNIRPNYGSFLDTPPF